MAESSSSAIDSLGAVSGQASGQGLQAARYPQSSGVILRDRRKDGLKAVKLFKRVLVIRFLIDGYCLQVPGERGRGAG